MRSILIDAGLLIALFDKSDSWHSKSIAFLKELKRPLITTWPVVTEVSYMLSFNLKVQMSFLEWIHRGGVDIIDIEKGYISRLIELTKKYNDVPLDLADATLIVAAEMTGIREIASIDGDFYVYRDIRNRYIRNVFVED